MARKKDPVPASRAVAINEAEVVESMGAANALALQQREADTRARAVAEQLGYQLPADSTDPSMIMRDIAANMRRSFDACIEMGRGLTVLKAACAHGTFIDCLDSLGIDRGVAARFMQAATKFANVPSTAHLTKAIGNQTKLFEMLVLDDEQIEELALTGQTGELALDDVATMSVKELRAALREAKGDSAAKDALLANKNAKIDKLERDKLRVKKLPPDEAQNEIEKAATSAMNDVRAALIGHLRQAFIAVQEGPGAGDKVPFMSGLFGQLQQDMNGLREEFRLLDLSDAADRVLVAELAQWDKAAEQTDEAKTH